MSTPEISRKQAWMKLAVLIADGLPQPQSIGFNPRSEDLCSIFFDANEPAFTAWCQALGGKRSADSASNDGTEWLHTGYVWNWHGWTLQLTANSPRIETEPEEITEDLTEVRKLASDG